MAIPAAIKPLGDYDKWIHFLCVGGPGFGKTVLAGTAPNALFLTTDPEGTISALAFGSKAQEWRIPDWTTFSEAYLWLKNGGIAEAGLDWVIVDNISEAQFLGMWESMQKARKDKPTLDEFVPSQHDYQRSQNMMKVFVKRFHDLPVNVMWTSWAERNEDAEGNVYFSPAIHGQKGALAQAIAGYMNVVAYGEVVQDAKGDDVRRLWFADHEEFKGKDRYNVLGQFMDRPSIPKIQTKIDGAVAAMNARPATRAVASKKPTAAASPRKVAPRAAATRRKA